MNKVKAKWIKNSKGEIVGIERTEIISLKDCKSNGKIEMAEYNDRIFWELYFKHIKTTGSCPNLDTNLLKANKEYE